VRIKLRMRSLKSGRDVSTSALVSSCFEAETQQLLIPRRLAAELGLWPPPEEATCRGWNCWWPSYLNSVAEVPVLREVYHCSCC